MNTNDKPTTAAEDGSLHSIIEGILGGLREKELHVTLSEDKAITAGTLNGRTVSFRIQGLTNGAAKEAHAVRFEPDGEHEVRSTPTGTVFLTFSYLRENDLQAAFAPDLSIGNRYHPARLAKRIGKPVPDIFDAVALALHQDYFRVATDEDRLPAEVTDCRLLFARGNWHPQVANLTEGVVADLKWVPAE
ncbi:MAG: hypothetical protein IT342_24520 [Candidatus Melainabacteria bacterium]|nr:hypothetical protein [Candidatus Melainabacteria bacterium]